MSTEPSIWSRVKLGKLCKGKGVSTEGGTGCDQTLMAN